MRGVHYRLLVLFVCFFKPSQHMASVSILSIFIIDQLQSSVPAQVKHKCRLKPAFTNSTAAAFFSWFIASKPTYAWSDLRCGDLT